MFGDTVLMEYQLSLACLLSRCPFYARAYALICTRVLCTTVFADYVVLIVSKNSPYKGVSRLLAAFVKAWQQASSLPSGEPGRLLLVCIGTSMPELADEVEQAAANLQVATQPAGAADGGAAQAGDTLQAAVHLLDETDNSTQRLGWYAAADVHVLNSGERGGRHLFCKCRQQGRFCLPAASRG